MACKSICSKSYLEMVLSTYFPPNGVNNTQHSAQMSGEGYIERDTFPHQGTLLQ